MFIVQSVSSEKFVIVIENSHRKQTQGHIIWKEIVPMLLLFLLGNI